MPAISINNMRIPFCPLPVNRAKIVAKRFYGLADPIARLSPTLRLELMQGGFNLDEREYLSIAIFTSLFTLLLVFVPLTIVFLPLGIEKALSIGFPVSLFLSCFTFFYLKHYPKLVVHKKISDVEKNLLYALRHMFVHVKAGIPLFDTLVAVSSANYGSVSSELRTAVKKINAGEPIDSVLEELSLKTTSLYFRRAVWQLSNGIKSGSDVGSILKTIIDNISSEQKIAIRRYGSQLNPLTLVYMMIAVIIPSLGITFLMVLSSFSGASFSESTFWFILAFLVLFQFMFLGLIKSRRPNIV